MHLRVVTFVPPSRVQALRVAGARLVPLRSRTWVDVGETPDSLAEYFDHERANLLILFLQRAAAQHPVQWVEQLEIRLAMWDATLLLLDGNEPASTRQAAARVCASALAPRLSVSIAPAESPALTLELGRLAIVAGMRRSSRRLTSLPAPLRGAFNLLPSDVQEAWRDLLARRDRAGFKSSSTHFGISRRSLERLHRAVGLPAPGAFLRTLRATSVEPRALSDE